MQAYDHIIIISWSYYLRRNYCVRWPVMNEIFQLYNFNIKVNSYSADELLINNKSNDSIIAKLNIFPIFLILLNQNFNLIFTINFTFVFLLYLYEIRLS
jgi:hypothetical protein